MPFPTIHPALDRALAERGYVEPTPVQAAVSDPALAGRDLLVSAQTGSGKTVAYGLALAGTLLGEAETFSEAGAPLALVVAPTRELALQVHRELTWLYAQTGAKVASCVGGMDIRREQRALEYGSHIVVGTPGRLRDHLERGTLDASAFRAVVLDEADEMLDLGFREDLEFLLDAAPAGRRTLLFSATIPRDIASLAKRFQKDAARVDTVDQSQPHGDIDYRALKVAPTQIEHGVVNVLRFFEARGAMVFCHTREAVRRLHGSLLERGFSAVALSGELTQKERGHALQSLRDGRARVCVATDVAARGIDLPDLGLVIHADMPSERDTLLHRSGRTGRAGRKGICVILVPYPRRRRAERLFAEAGIDANWGAPPSADEIRARDQERLVQDPIFSEESTEEDVALGRALLAGRTAEEIATALVRFHRGRLPSPEEMLTESTDRERRRDPEIRGTRRSDAQAQSEAPAEGMVWFQMNVGRRNNADPRWLLPIICRIGHVTKREVGTIRIFDRETRFEIADHVAARYAAAARKTADSEEVRIQPAGDGPMPAPSERPPRPTGPRGPRPAGDGPRGPRPPSDGPRGPRPAGDGPKKPWLKKGKGEGFAKGKPPAAYAKDGPPRSEAGPSRDGPAKKDGPPRKDGPRKKDFSGKRRDKPAGRE
jgi:ATP-dependent RNA helicase DeaD